MDAEIQIRVQRIIISYNKMAARVFHNRHLHLKLKLRIFDAIPMANGLYACASWNTSKRHMEQLETIQFRLLRRLMGVRRLDFVAKENLLKRAENAGVKIWPMGMIIRMRRLLYVGSILRQRDDSILKIVLHSEMVGAQKGSGKGWGTETLYRNCIKADLEEFGISQEEWKSVPRKDEGAEWAKVVERGLGFCFEKWLDMRAMMKRKRAYAEDIKMAPLLRAIELGNVSERLCMGDRLGTAIKLGWVEVVRGGRNRKLAEEEDV